MEVFVLQVYLLNTCQMVKHFSCNHQWDNKKMTTDWIFTLKIESEWLFLVLCMSDLWM